MANTHTSKIELNVELDENKCEGMIPLNSIKDDQYYYDNELKLIMGHNSRKSFMNAALCFGQHNMSTIIVRPPM